MALVWVIIDDIAGNANQAIAIAKALDEKYEIKKLKYNFLGFLPNLLKFSNLMGINLKLSDKIEPPFPDIVISSGRKTAPVSSYIKKYKPNTFTIHIMNPDLPYKDFDLVLLPNHDKKIDSEKILYTIGAPGFLDKDEILQSIDNFSQKNKNIESPKIVLFIGGKTKKGDYSDNDYDELFKSFGKIKASLLVSTSRRTNFKSIDEKLRQLDKKYYLYDWHNNKNQFNPYKAFLGMGDYFVVTGDSVSIISDCLSTGKPVYVFRKDKVLTTKHIKFLDYLAKRGYIQYISEAVESFKDWSYTPLNEAKRVSEIIKDKANASYNIAFKDT